MRAQNKAACYRNENKLQISGTGKPCLYNRLHEKRIFSSIQYVDSIDKQYIRTAVEKFRAITGTI